MAITQAFCNVAKQAAMSGDLDFSATTSKTYRIALYTASATLDATTTAYTTTNEVTGSGYTAGGLALTISDNTSLDGSTAIMSFANINWPNASFTARGCMIYDEDDDMAVAVFDFGQDVTVSNGNFEVQFPANTAAAAVLRIG